jgi:hypothetical protein
MSRLVVSVIALVLARQTAVAEEFQNCNATCHPRDSFSKLPTIFSWGVREPSNAREEDAPIVTDRPHFSEASSLVGLGVWQIETGYTYYGNDDDVERTGTSSLPEALLRVGLFVNWFELRIGTNFLSERTRTNGHRESNGGFDDLYLGAKLGLFEQKGWLPEVALFPQTRIPVGQKDFTMTHGYPVSTSPTVGS